MTSELADRIRSRTAVIAVVGCGYVGLPVCVAFAEAGSRVLGIDSDINRVADLSRGISHIADIDSSRLAQQIKASRLSFTSDFTTLSEADVIFVAVPTPADRAKQPD